MEADTEFRRRHFGLDVRDGFQRVSVIASMIDMVEFAYGVRRRRRALVGSLARGHQYPPLLCQSDHQGLGVLATMESMPKPQ